MHLLDNAMMYPRAQLTLKQCYLKSLIKKPIIVSQPSLNKMGDGKLYSKKLIANKPKPLYLILRY